MSGVRDVKYGINVTRDTWDNVCNHDDWHDSFVNDMWRIVADQLRENGEIPWGEPLFYYKVREEDESVNVGIRLTVRKLQSITWENKGVVIPKALILEGLNG